VIDLQTWFRYLIIFIKTSAPIKEPQILAIISRNSKSLPSKNKYWQTSMSIPTPIVITNDISNGHFVILFKVTARQNSKTNAKSYLVKKNRMSKNYSP
jgi:hypothetical protein